MESLAESAREQPAMPRFEDGSVNLRELMRRMAEDVVNAIMDAGADQLCAGGANSRNGYRERNLVTCVGDITMRISKLRPGSFSSEDVVERYQRVNRAVVSAVAEMYATGTSTRKVQRIAEKLGGSRPSKDLDPPSARSNSERPKQKHRAPTAQYHLPCTNPLTFFPLSRCSWQAQPQPHR